LKSIPGRDNWPEPDPHRVNRRKADVIHKINDEMVRETFRSIPTARQKKVLESFRVLVDAAGEAHIKRKERSDCPEAAAGFGATRRRRADGDRQIRNSRGFKEVNGRIW